MKDLPDPDWINHGGTFAGTTHRRETLWDPHAARADETRLHRRLVRAGHARPQPAPPARRDLPDPERDLVGRNRGLCRDFASTRCPIPTADSSPVARSPAPGISRAVDRRRGVERRSRDRLALAAGPAARAGACSGSAVTHGFPAAARAGPGPDGGRGPRDRAHPHLPGARGRFPLRGPEPARRLRRQPRHEPHPHAARRRRRAHEDGLRLHRDRARHPGVHVWLRDPDAESGAQGGWPRAAGFPRRLGRRFGRRHDRPGPFSRGARRAGHPAATPRLATQRERRHERHADAVRAGERNVRVFPPRRAPARDGRLQQDGRGAAPRHRALRRDDRRQYQCARCPDRPQLRARRRDRAAARERDDPRAHGRAAHAGRGHRHGRDARTRRVAFRRSAARRRVAAALVRQGPVAPLSRPLHARRAEPLRSRTLLHRRRLGRRRGDHAALGGRARCARRSSSGSGTRRSASRSTCRRRRSRRPRRFRTAGRTWPGCASRRSSGTITCASSSRS